jgi:hypothetical protein
MAAKQGEHEHLARPEVLLRCPDASFRALPYGADDVHVVVSRLPMGWEGPGQLTRVDASTCLLYGIA